MPVFAFSQPDKCIQSGTASRKPAAALGGLKSVGQEMFSCLKVSNVGASEVTHALRLRINHGCKQEAKT